MGKPLKGKTAGSDHGQKKISSFFSSSSNSSLFSSVGKEVKPRRGNDSDQDSKIQDQKLLSSKSSKSKLSLVKLADNHPRKAPDGKLQLRSLHSKLPVANKYGRDKGKIADNANSQGSTDISSDSDLEIIENTPQIKRNGKKCTISTHFDDMSSSPDFIPSTPQLRSVDVSSTCLLSVSRNSKSSLSLLSAKSQNCKKASAIKPKPLYLKSKLSSKKPDLKTKNEILSSSIVENQRTVDSNHDLDNSSKVDSQVILKGFGKENIDNLLVCSSLKRSATTGTGVSPDPKRIVTPDRSLEFVKENNVKMNLLCKFDGNSPAISEGESESSFSLLQGNMTNKLNLKYEDSEGVEDPSVENMARKVLVNSLECKVPKIIVENNKIKGNDVCDDKKSILEVESYVKNAKELFDVSQEFEVDIPHEEKKHKANIVEETQDVSFELKTLKVQELEVSCKVKNDKVESDVHDIEDTELGTFFDNDLSSCFEQMSPFKEEVKKIKEPVTENKDVKRIINEGLGKDSYSIQGNFGRHIVTGVECNPYASEKILQITCLQDQSSKTCSLKGFWYQSIVREGDIVHILYTHHINGHYTIDNNNGLLVVNPDFLVSGTSVVSAVFCRRKSVLNERFKSLESGNQAMLVGSLVHQLFQEVVKEKIVSREKLQALVKQLMAQPNIIRDMYGMEVSEATILEEVNNYIPRIYDWAKRYLSADVPKISKGQRNNQWEGKIQEIQDIEENVWSPKFGIKGKIDLTVKSYHKGVSKVVPLELKTGRSSFSAEHRGQVTLYSMMSADRREDPRSGLLLYLKDGAMEEIPAGENEKKGLIQLRNEMTSYLTAKPVLSEGSSIMKLPNLPEPISFERACNRCAHLLTCTLYQKSIEEVTPESSHPMATLIPQATSHLNQAHMDYFRLWCLLLHLEMAVNKNGRAIRSMWCQDPSLRESLGNCLSSVILDPSANITEETGRFFHTFIRSPEHPSDTKLDTIGLMTSESVVISTGSEIALCIGVIAGYENDQVCIVLDRNLKKYPNWQKKLFMIDRCEYQNTMSLVFTNLARLLEDNPRAASLRSLVVEKTVPSFKSGLPQEIVSKGRTILKRLNKKQQRAVLRTLLAEDYSLLKGFPGTGKTSTIIALVELMVILGYSVLLTSYTHSAVDNILLKLKSRDVDFLRLGRVSRIHPDLLPYADERNTNCFKDVASLSEFYSSKRIVATTCLGMNHVIFTKRTFDFCIVDEASQVLQAVALGPLFHASRFVLVGDPLQLPPIVQSTQAVELGMRESLFMRLDEDSLGATSCLTDQYRMNAQVMKLPNCLMYDGQLQCASADLENKTVELPNYKNMIDNSSIPSWVQRALDPKIECSVVFMDTDGTAPEKRDCSNQLVNDGEISLVLTLIRAFLEAGIMADDVGIITPYQAQVKKIRKIVTKDVTNGHRVEVNTVDQYQGRDKDVIIYSCVRSGTDENERSQILRDDRRLNVAITRAKYKLIMIGHSATLQLYSPFQKLISHLDSSQIYQFKNGVDGYCSSESY